MCARNTQASGLSLGSIESFRPGSFRKGGSCSTPLAVGDTLTIMAKIAIMDDIASGFDGIQNA
jgi:hypothetical protein